MSTGMNDNDLKPEFRELVSHFNQTELKDLFGVKSQSNVSQFVNKERPSPKDIAALKWFAQEKAHKILETLNTTKG